MSLAKQIFAEAMRTLTTERLQELATRHDLVGEAARDELARREHAEA